jgi:hypothetical protein
VVDLPEQGVVRFTRMFVPEPAWRLNAWIAPQVRDIHLHLGRGLDIVPFPRHDVLWLSRRRLKNRMPYDEALLEWILGEHITAISPETMTLAEQVAALEASRAVAGVIGSAFHTLLMVADLPECLYLCPDRFQSAHIVQDRVLKTNASFMRGLADARFGQLRKGIQSWARSPAGHRLLIPEVLRAFDATVLPGLLDDQRLAAFAHAERFYLGIGDGAAVGEVDVAVAKVLLDPISVRARLELGAILEAEGLTRCAVEQYTAATSLAEDQVDGPLKAARLLHLQGQLEEAAAMANRVLAIDPDSKEAARYVISPDGE